ncbi:Putative glycosyltransferase EpsH [bacterium HR40]|nr:Putative glycosyltransferase EpsH [bacterium HR40]
MATPSPPTRSSAGTTEAARPTLCIINYNGETHLRQSLPAAVAQADLFAEILLVDNGSSDGSVAFVEQHFPMVRILRLPDNRGAGAARNAGIREAASDRILMLDNDVVLLDGCAEALAASLDAHPTAAAAAATVLYARNPTIVQYDGADSHYLGLMILQNADRPLAERQASVRFTNSLVTCCFMLDRRRIPPGVQFDEDYFYIAEDHDFGLQLREAGCEILAVPHAYVLHGDGTAELSIRQLGGYSRLRVLCTIRNRWLILAKHYAARTLLVLAPMLLLYELVQLAAVIKKGWWREWCEAARWMIRHLPETLDKRRRIQQQRRLPDRAILVGGPLPLRPELVTSSGERLARRMLDWLVSSYWRIVARMI